MVSRLPHCSSLTVNCKSSVKQKSHVSNRVGRRKKKRLTLGIGECEEQEDDGELEDETIEAVLERDKQKLHCVRRTMDER